MYRLKVKRTFFVNGKHPEGFVVGTLEELKALADMEDCIVLSDPYNPEGFLGSLQNETIGDDQMKNAQTATPTQIAREVADSIIHATSADQSVQHVVNALVEGYQTEVIASVALMIHESTDDNKVRNNLLSKLRSRLARASKKAKFNNPMTVKKEELDDETVVSYIVDFVQPKEPKLTDFDKALEALLQKAVDEDRQTEFHFALVSVIKALDIEPVEPVEPVTPKQTPKSVVVSVPKVEGVKVPYCEKSESFIEYFPIPDGDENACAVASSAVAFDLEYSQVSKAYSNAGRKKNMGATVATMQKAIDALATQTGKQVTHKCMLFERLTLAQLKALNPVGRFIVVKRNHAFAVVDGKTIDHTNWGGRTQIQYFWQVEG